MGFSFLYVLLHILPCSGRALKVCGLLIGSLLACQWPLYMKVNTLRARIAWAVTLKWYTETSKLKFLIIILTLTRNGWISWKIVNDLLWLSWSNFRMSTLSAWSHELFVASRYQINLSYFPLIWGFPFQTWLTSLFEADTSTFWESIFTHDHS